MKYAIALAWMMAVGSAAALGQTADKATEATRAVAKARLAGTWEEREEGFRKARQRYEDAIAQAEKDAAAAPAGGDRDRLQMQAIRLRLDLANMIFQTWLKTDLDYLEVTDRLAGDRAHAAELLKAAMEQIRVVNAGVKKALAAIPDMDRIRPSLPGGLELRKIEREAKYAEAWITYYYGWALPANFKPEAGESGKQDFLRDAIDLFGAYTALPDKSSAKWYALMVTGLCQRELGKFDEALKSLDQADGCDALNEAEQETIKVRIVFERSLVLLQKGDFDDVHKTIDDARKTWGGKLKRSVFGVSLPLVEGRAWIEEGAKKNNAGLKQKGISLLVDEADKGPVWSAIIRGMLDTLAPEAAKKVREGTLKVVPQENWAPVSATRGDEGVRGFFGVAGDDTEKTKVVFVLDRGGAMIEYMDFVKYELKRVIGEFDDSRQFHVIFYTGGPLVEAPPRRLVNATERNKEAAFNFLDGVVPQGLAEPTKALERAFALRPDVIYLLVNGQLDPSVADLVKRLNLPDRQAGADGHVTVHAILLMNKETEEVLPRIAKENGGQFKRVGEKDLENLAR